MGGRQVLALALVAGSLGVPAARVPSTARIAFVSDRDGVQNIWTTDAAGGHLREVTHERPTGGAVDLARDGRYAFADDTSVWIADARAHSFRRLALGTNPMWSPDGTRVAFGRDAKPLNSPNDGVWVVNADGTGLREVARAPGVTSAPRLTWSPDGRRLAYATDDVVVVVDLADGRRWRLVRAQDAEVAWSPDGRTIAYVDGVVGDVFEVPSGGGRPTRLTRTPTVDEYALAWRPDGTLTFLADAGDGRYAERDVRADGGARRTLFMLPSARLFWPPHLSWSGDGREVVVSAEFGGTVYRIDADGTHWRTILPGGPATSPSWSGDGKRLAYASPWHVRVFGPGAKTRTLPFWCQQITWAPDGSRLVCGRDDIYELDLAGKFRSKTLLRDQGIGDDTKSDPAFAPDGGEFVFDEPDARSLALYDFARPQQVRILSLSGSPQTVPDVPAWSRDGTEIAFAGHCKGASQPCTPGIFVVSATGGKARRIVRDGENPDWSPDGTRLVFDRTVRGNRDIWMVDADGGHLRRLTHDGAAESDPSWRP